MEFNYNKLRGRIVEYGYNLKTCADKMGIDRTSLSQKLNNHTSFSNRDILRLCDMLNIPTEEIGTYFFTNQVEKTQV